MKHLIHSLPSPPKLLPPPPPSPQLHTLPSPQLTFNIPRRSLAIIAPLLLPTFSSLADTTAATTCSPIKPTTKTAFIDVSVDGQPVGRITIGLDESSAPYGATRFAKLVSGSAGISYRRKEFIKIMPNYMQHAGVRSYGVDAELAARTGNTTTAADSLKAEWEASLDDKCVKNVAGSVGIVVRDPTKPPPKVKIVAKEGKLKVEEEEVGVEPNGTEFVIVTRDSPELDQSVLVVGRVVEGMEVVERIAQVKTVQENTSSPYFR